MLKFKSFNHIKSFCIRYSSTKVLQNDRTNDHFYITTPIFYVNSKPHLGHLYTLVVADAYFRFQKLLQNHQNYIFATGTDEHGLKIQEAAENASMDCKEFCDLNSNFFRDLCDKFSISNTHFIRTSDDEHQKVVHKVWNELDRRGFIYKTNYDGWYSVSDETFIPNKQVKTVDDYRNSLNKVIEQQSNEPSDNETNENEIQNPIGLINYLDLQLNKHPNKNSNEFRVDSKTGNLLEHSQESNYIFKLENFKDRLIKLIKNEEKFISPDSFRNILLNMIESESLNSISISRSKSRFTWGISVPNDENQIIYVWFDALCNYLTVANYNSSSKEFSWPPSVQVLGKDIIKFHAIYWPAFLFALDLELPLKLHCHAHWMVNDLKMSKSKGNVINPFDYLDLFKADGIRYFLLKTGVPHADGNFNEKKLKEYSNADLADTLGNLLQRSTNLKLNAEQCFPILNQHGHSTDNNDLANELIQKLNDLPSKVYPNYENGNFYLVIEEVMSVLHKCNKFFFVEEPWKLIKQKSDDNERKLKSILHLTYETLRIASILLSPIIPNCTDVVFNKLNIPENERYWKDCKLKMYRNEDELRKFSQAKLILYEKVFIN